MSTSADFPTQLGPARSDEPPSQRRCATMTVHRRMLDDVAGYAAARAEIENRTMAFARRMGAAPRQDLRIPVVVHVVWNTEQQNVSDEQVRSQIDVLNQDFRRTNPDVSNVPEVWKGLVADTHLTFELATEDPSGNPSDGIIRRQTDQTSFGADDGVKANASGGSDPWPTDRYLNIWVCELGGGLLGYAQFPGGPAATDGVVVTHTGFGTTGTASAPFHLGRTTTHEIGHYLNCFHIWGDDGQGCSGSDQVGDTPNQGGPNFGVPTFPKLSCNNGPNGDMFVNYMDYTDDAGMVMFTHGQSARMAATLGGPRASLPIRVAAAQPAGMR